MNDISATTKTKIFTWRSIGRKPKRQHLDKKLVERYNFVVSIAWFSRINRENLGILYIYCKKKPKWAYKY